MLKKGQIIENISNLYKVQTDKEIIECSARGKFKQGEISPIVGDYVEVENGVICNILPRNTYLKRPKIANLTRNSICNFFKISKARFFTFR